MSNLEFFDVLVPLPFRIIIYINIGVWLWLLTLKISSRFGINVNLVLKFDHLNTLPFITNHEQLSTTVSIYSTISYIIYLTLHNDQKEQITFVDFIPLITIGYILFLLINPNNAGSIRVYKTIKRIFKGDISADYRTNDILLSDTLTSYSKTLIDLSVYLCHLISNKTCLPKNTQSTIDRSCGSSIFLDSIIGFLPNLIRLSQCYVEYLRTDNVIHIYNFLKYLTNFPVLLIGLLTKSNSSYTNLWILVAFINSSYSFFWDVTNDWNLNLFKQFISNEYNKNGLLRGNLKYNVKFFYYLAIIADFILRFIWILKFLPIYEDSTLVYDIISHLYTTEIGLFLLQSLELFRRWIWVFIKLEVEFINANRDIEMNPLR